MTSSFSIEIIDKKLDNNLNINLNLNLKFPKNGIINLYNGL